jgi:hypothetical protein
MEPRRSSSQSNYNFCNNCHLEHLRRLNDEEQRKLQEIEEIKREKETLIKSCAKFIPGEQQNPPQASPRQTSSVDNHTPNNQDTAGLFTSQDHTLFQTSKSMESLSHRKIGKLNLNERYLKIKRFKEKKQRRIWTKKIFYDCRKQVADKRVRIKGRFICKED